jgi:hypothetical protein
MPLRVASFHASGEAADRNDLERGVVQGRYRTRQMIAGSFTTARQTCPRCKQSHLPLKKLLYTRSLIRLTTPQPTVGGKRGAEIEVSVPS